MKTKQDTTAKVVVHQLKDATCTLQSIWIEVFPKRTYIPKLDFQAKVDQW